MRITILTPSISRKAGGLLDAVRHQASALAAQGPARVDVLGLEDEHTEADRPLWRPLEPCTFPVAGPRALGYAPALRRSLDALGPDLLHIHGLWLYPSLASLCWSRRWRRPHVISPHGMLHPWALRLSRWKKAIARRLYENAHLRRAACIHALCAAEAQSVRAFGLRNPICVIPNGIDLPAGGEPSVSPPWREHWGEDCRVLLYLGRLHPDKGLTNLVAAWQQLRRRHNAWGECWRLAVFGWDQGGHGAELEAQIREAGLAGEVRLFGPAYGPMKDAALRGARAFVLPSLREGVPMAVLEAWAYHLPVLMTPQCNLPDAVAAGAAVEADPSVADLARGLEELFRLSETQRRDMGERGHRLVAEKFSVAKVGAQLFEVYRWLAGGGARPDCVWLD